MDNQTALTPLSTDEKPSIINIKSMELWYEDMSKLAKDILRENLDYGVIPTTKKKSLWKAGAEKLRMAFGLSIEIKIIDKIERPEEGYLDYTYKAIVRTRSGQQIAECDGNCNTYETKYRYIWETQDIKPNKEEANRLRAQKLGKWTKVNNDWLWQLRKDNTEPLNLKNTILKMAQKRAFIGAILIATGASEFYTQDFDIEDLQEIDHSGPEQIPESEGQTVVDTLIQKLQSSNDIEELDKVSDEIKALGKKIAPEQTVSLRQAYSKRKAEIKIIAQKEAKAEVKTEGGKNEKDS